MTLPFPANSAYVHVGCRTFDIGDQRFLAQLTAAARYDIYEAEKPYYSELSTSPEPGIRASK